MNHKLIDRTVSIILGIMMIGSGIAMLLGIIGNMHYSSQPANDFLQAMNHSNYFFQFLALVKILCGLSFLFNRYEKLMLIIFMPVSINMVLFHIFLAPAEGIPAYLILMMNIYLMINRLNSYRPLLTK